MRAASETYAHDSCRHHRADSEALQLVDCKAALGISGTSQDAVITAAIGAATDVLDAATGGWLGRAIVSG
ncbi:phage head-tail connector protein [Bradyrhizobium sp. AZCC 2230]|uniref:phage head-tail connector protein n=1 Tax=Bradyrhizobium sp. AZCC 2230 TaxID=3117021 RepID=UPI002FF133F4